MHLPSLWLEIISACLSAFTYNSFYVNYKQIDLFYFLKLKYLKLYDFLLRLLQLGVWLSYPHFCVLHSDC